MSKKFQPLDYSRGWDDYWRDHPQGYSPQEQMVNWSGQLNAMIDFFNEYFDVDLSEYATDVMEGWYFDGRLEDIINEALFESKADKTTVNSLIDTVEYMVPKINDIAINVKMFGAKGDGITDDSQAIKDAIAALPQTGGTLLFPAGVYLHGDGTTTGFDYTPYTLGENGKKRPNYEGGAISTVGRDIRLLFSGYNNINIVGYGAKIISNPNNGEVMHNNIFWFDNCENVVIQGIEVDGNIDNRMPEYSDYTPAGGRWYARHNFQFLNTNNITIRDIKSNNSMMDGICFDENCQYVLVENSEFLYNYRQGITLGSNIKDVIIRGCNISFTGQKHGTMPMAGIDLEGNAGGPQENVLIQKCRFEKNKGESVALYLHTMGVIVKDCYMLENESLRGESGQTSYNNTIDGCYFLNENIEMRQKGAHIKNCTMKYTKDFGVDHVKGGGAIMINSDSVVTTDFNILNARPSVIENNTIICDYEEIGTHYLKFRMGKMYLHDDTLHINNNKIVNASSNQAGVYLVDIKCDNLYMKNNMWLVSDEINVDNYSPSNILFTNAVISDNIASAYLSGTTSVIKDNKNTRNLEGTITWDPIALADGEGETSPDIIITGAKFGDYIVVSPPYNLQGVMYNAYISAANTVKIRLQNETGATVDLGSGVWKIKVVRT